MMLMFVFTSKEVFSLPLAAASHSLNKGKRDSCTFRKSFQKAQHGSFIYSLQTSHPAVTGQLLTHKRGGNCQLLLVRQRSQLWGTASNNARHHLAGHLHTVVLMVFNALAATTFHWRVVK